MTLSPVLAVLTPDRARYLPTVFTMHIESMSYRHCTTSGPRLTGDAARLRM